MLNTHTDTSMNGVCKMQHQIAGGRGQKCGIG